MCIHLAPVGSNLTGKGYMDQTITTDRPAFAIAPIMLTAFAGSAAMMAFVALVGPIARIGGLDAWQVGVAVTAAGVAWILSAPYWGSASDRHGRRPILLIGVGGFAISYTALCLLLGRAADAAVGGGLLFAGLVIGRTFAGLFYSAVPPVCAALVADHYPPQRRTSAMAAIGAANALGMVLGPGGAGLLAAYSMSLSLNLLAALPLVALVTLWFALPREAPRASVNRPALKLTDRRIRRAAVTAFIAMSSVVVAQIIVGFFALDRLGLAPPEAARASGIALALVGAALFVSQMVLRQLPWPPLRLIRAGGVVAAIGFGAVATVDGVFGLWIAYAVAAAGMGWVYPSISALVANSVEAHEQGAAAGVVGAAKGLGAAIAPIVGTAIYGIDQGAPYLVVGSALLGMALWPARRG